MPETHVKKAAPATKTVTVHVSLVEGKLQVVPAFVRMGLNDKIRWTSKDLDFWVVFDHQTPFERHAFESPHASDPRRPLLYGAFKYSVVLERDHSVRLDPVVVVDPPPEDPYVKGGG